MRIKEIAKRFSLIKPVKTLKTRMQNVNLNESAKEQQKFEGHFKKENQKP